MCNYVYRYDTETGLYYLQSRYYNPEWGRFINADGIIGQTGELLGHNLFVYCGNSPVSREDPSGFMWRMAGEDGGSYDEFSIKKNVIQCAAIGYTASNTMKDSQNFKKVKSGVHAGEIRGWKPGTTDTYCTPVEFAWGQVKSSLRWGGLRDNYLVTAAVSGTSRFIDSGFKINEDVITRTIADTFVGGIVEYWHYLHR